MKFGRLPSAPEKLARRLMLRDYLDRDVLPAIPSSVDYTQIGQAWGMLLNDSIGDCTIAGAGHADMVADYYGEKVAANITDAQILAAYEAITGYNPDDPSSDQGANLLDVLRYWQRAGIGDQKAGPYVAFDATAMQHWQAVTFLFGFAYIGVWLPKTVTDPLESGQVIDWTDTSDPVTQDAGHCVIVAGYDATGLDVVTWGQVIHMSWAFAAKYVDEPYAVILPNWGTGKEPVGLNVSQLQADLAVVQGGGIIPAPTPPNPTPPSPPPAPTPTPSPTPAPTPVNVNPIVAELDRVEKALVRAANEIAAAVKRITDC